MPNSGTTRKSCVHAVICSTLVLSLITVGGAYLLLRDVPHLTEVVSRTPLNQDAFIYGVRDERGGATVPYSYRYYVFRALGTDSEVLGELKNASPFLVTRDDSPAIKVQGSEITVSADKEISAYHSKTLYRHANGVDYTPVNVYLHATPSTE